MPFKTFRPGLDQLGPVRGYTNKGRLFLISAPKRKKHAIDEVSAAHIQSFRQRHGITGPGLRAKINNPGQLRGHPKHNGKGHISLPKLNLPD